MGNQRGIKVESPSRHMLWTGALLKAPAHWNAALEEPQKAAPRSLRKSSSSTFLAPPPAQPEVLQDSSATPDKSSPDRSPKKSSKQNNANKARTAPHPLGLGGCGRWSRCLLRRRWGAVGWVWAGTPGEKERWSLFDFGQVVRECWWVRTT